MPLKACCFLSFSPPLWWERSLFRPHFSRTLHPANAVLQRVGQLTQPAMLPGHAATLPAPALPPAAQHCLPLILQCVRHLLPSECLVLLQRFNLTTVTPNKTSNWGPDLSLHHKAMLYSLPGPTHVREMSSGLTAQGELCSPKITIHPALQPVHPCRNP